MNQQASFYDHMAGCGGAVGCGVPDAAFAPSVAGAPYPGYGPFGSPYYDIHGRAAPADVMGQWAGGGYPAWEIRGGGRPDAMGQWAGGGYPAWEINDYGGGGMYGPMQAAGYDGMGRWAAGYPAWEIHDAMGQAGQTATPAVPFTTKVKDFLNEKPVLGIPNWGILAGASGLALATYGYYNGWFGGKRRK